VTKGRHPGLERRVATVGRHRLAALPAGTYTLRVSMQGFATDVRCSLG